MEYQRTQFKNWLHINPMESSKIKVKKIHSMTKGHYTKSTDVIEKKEALQEKDQRIQRAICWRHRNANEPWRDAWSVSPAKCQRIAGGGRAGECTERHQPVERDLATGTHPLTVYSFGPELEGHPQRKMECAILFFLQCLNSQTQTAKPTNWEGKQTRVHLIPWCHQKQEDRSILI